MVYRRLLAAVTNLAATAKKKGKKRSLKSLEMSHEPNSNWGCCYCCYLVQKSCMFLSFLFCIILFFSSLQTTLATFGIETQTPQQIEPIQIWPPSELVKVIFQHRQWSKRDLNPRPADFKSAPSVTMPPYCSWLQQTEPLYSLQGRGYLAKFYSGAPTARRAVKWKESRL